MRMSLKGKLATCTRKVVEVSKAFQEFNEFIADGQENVGQVQSLFLLDTERKAHCSGFGNLFENFLNNQQLDYFSGKGTQPISSTDPNAKHSLLQVEKCEDVKCRKRKCENMLTCKL